MNIYYIKFLIYFLSPFFLFKMKNKYLLTLCVLITFSSRAFSQTFTSPTYSGSGVGPPSDFTVDGKYVDLSSDPVTIPATGNKPVAINFQLHRPSATPTAGYVNVYYGTSSNNLSPNPIVSQVPATNGWLNDSANPGNDVIFLAPSQVNISASAANGYTGFYAVYFSTLTSPAGIKGAISDPVFLKISSPGTPVPTPTPTPTPTPVPPLSYYIPCTNIEICSNQCVAYGALPALINGRVLATSAQDYTDYRTLVAKQGQQPFAQYAESEAVQWQYSYTNNGQDWKDISGANTRNYQPGFCTQTTYYRRSSTHHLYSAWRFGSGGYFIDHWYDSNTVTITPGAAQPVPVQSTYNTCGSGNTVVAIQQSANATSYNWWVPYQGWGVSNDGTNPYSTFSNNSSFVTNNTKVFITIPSGVAAGDYQIAVSANGGCSPKSPDGIITIHVVPGSSPIGEIGDYKKVTKGTGDNTVYNIAIPQVVNATSYSAQAQVDGSTHSALGTLSGSQIVFDVQLPCSYLGQVIVTATGSCNTTSRTFNVKTPYCGTGIAAPIASLGLYPNPAAEQVIIGSVEQEATAFFYDAQGILRKQVIVHAQDKETSINTQDLLTGLYHVSIQAHSKVLLTKQLFVQH